MAKRRGPPTKMAAGFLAELQEWVNQLATLVITDHFFDPEREDAYGTALAAMKRSKAAETLLTETEYTTNSGSSIVRLFARPRRGALRLTVTGPSMAVAVDGVWSFDEEALHHSTVSISQGEPAEVVDAVCEILAEIEGRLLREEDLNGLLESAGDELTALAGYWFFDDDEDDDEDLTEISEEELCYLRDLSVRIARSPTPALSPADRAWLEERPGLLIVILESFIAAARSADNKVQDRNMLAWLVLFGTTLESLRPSIDEREEWSLGLMYEVQERMVEAATDDELPHESWMLLVAALTDVGVPVSDEMQTRLAEAGLTLSDEIEADDLLGMLRQTLDTVAALNLSPFEVMQGLRATDAVSPASTRCFMALEMALSPHATLRDTVPLMLLDRDASVRRQAAQALEQTARPETLSGAALRRMIAVRNWLPPDDRHAVDSAIRTARLAGVQPEPWPAGLREVEVFASAVDGSGAQSIVFTAPRKRNSMVGCLLLRHGEGVHDAWLREDVKRADCRRMIQDIRDEMAYPVSRGYADLVIQHAIAASTATGRPPMLPLLNLAEMIGAADWQDRRLDIAAEVEAEWQRLPAPDRTESGDEQLQTVACEWFGEFPMFDSWFEGGPEIERRYRTMKPDRALRHLLKDELPAHRMRWAERFLLCALWFVAGNDLTRRAAADAFIAVARALTGDRPIAAIPAMQHIAARSVAMTRARRR